MPSPRASRFPALLTAALLALGCDAKPEASETAKAETASETSKKAPAKERGWSVTYSGDESGKISGKVSQITSVAAGLYVVASDLNGNSMTVGVAVAPTDTGSYPAETFNITIDKEVCEQKDGEPVQLVVTDGTKTSLAFTLSGTLQCEGKRGALKVEGSFRKK